MHNGVRRGLITFYNERFCVLSLTAVFVYLKNIPQLVIQIVFFAMFQQSQNNIILYLAMTFSILSIIISALSMISTRSISRNTDYVSIEFDVTGLSDIKQCRNRVKKIKSAFSTSIGVNALLFDISRPIQIQRGLKMSINMKLNYTKQIDMNIEKLMNDMNQSGELAEILKLSWSLTNTPKISNINVTKHESKERRIHKVVVNHKSEDIRDPKGVISTFSKVELPPVLPNIAPTDMKVNYSGNRDYHDRKAVEIICGSNATQGDDLSTSDEPDAFTIETALHQTTRK